VWAQGDGGTFQTYKLPIGILGGLIGGEHYLPLARHALYTWGTQFYIAATWEHGEPWLSTLRHIAREGHAFVISCGMVLRAGSFLDKPPFNQISLPGGHEWFHSGNSVIINPQGEFITGFTQEEEALLYAEINPGQPYWPERILDIPGADARPDIFQLTVSCEPHKPLWTKGILLDGDREIGQQESSGISDI
jgi:nitrilase